MHLLNFSLLESKRCFCCILSTGIQRPPMYCGKHDQKNALGVIEKDGLIVLSYKASQNKVLHHFFCGGTLCTRNEEEKKTHNQDVKDSCPWTWVWKTSLHLMRSINYVWDIFLLLYHSQGSQVWLLGTTWEQPHLQYVNSVRHNVFHAFVIYISLCAILTRKKAWT